MFSTVRLNGEIGRAYCMFCGNSDSTWCNTGEITAKDYKILMDSGWRRVGTIIRRPNRLKTCCPTYALYCGAENFRLSKSQKKVLRGFNNYLSGKGKFNDATKASVTSTCCEDQSVGANNLASSPQVLKSGASGDAKMSANGIARNAGAKRKSESVKKGSVANSCCTICPTDVNNHQTIPEDVVPQFCQDTGRSADKQVNLSARKKFKHATETSVPGDCVGNRPNHVTNHSTNPKVVKRQVSKDSGFVD
ncbi:Arginyl-tRNA--protein transferase 2, partial [Taenia solium]